MVTRPQPGDLAVWDGHVAMIIGDGTMIEVRYQYGCRTTATFETGPRVSPGRCARPPPTIDAMPLQIHTQPDPDHFCETCGGPSELVSQTITPWDGNETMAREVSPWTPRCADPWCQSRRPRHSKVSDTRVCGP